MIADKKSKFNIYSHYFQLISALEGYQRRNNESLDENNDKKHEEYIEDLKLKVKDCLKHTERKKLFHKLKYSNKITLKQRIYDLIKQSEIKQLIILEEGTHNLIFKFIIQVRNDIAHLNDNNDVDEKIKTSFEYLKLTTLLIMMKDISLSHTHISKNILDMDLKYIEQKLIKAFGVKDTK